jgi:Transglutaminase-like superfamily
MTAPQDDSEARLPVADLEGWRIDRRLFLKLVGASVAAAGVAQGITFASAGAQGATAPTSDPIGDLASSLNYDSTQIFRFVADQIRYEPYEGVLRGAAGTLESGAGNSADKASLLSALLREGLVQTVFVTGSLDDAASGQILSQPPLSSSAARDRITGAIQSTLPGLTAPPASTTDLPPDLAEIVAQAPQLAAAATTWFNTLLDGEVAAISDALSKAGVTIPAASVALPKLERDQHVWVRMQNGSNWVDLDPTVPGAAVGATLTSASGDQLDALPDDLRHRIDVTVTLESVQGGVPAEQPIAVQSYFADAVAGQPFVFGHQQPTDLAAIGISISSALTGSGPVYAPVLAVGPDGFVGSASISFGGDGGGIFSGPSPSAGPGEGEALAEYLDVRVTRPDGTSSVAHRTLFDRVGASARAQGDIDLSTVPPVETVTEQDGTTWAVPMLPLRFLSLATGTSSVASLDNQGPDDDQTMPLGAGAPLYHIAHAAAAATFGIDRGVVPYADGVNLAMVTLIPEQDASGPTGLGTAFDLLHRAQGNLPLSDSTPKAAPGIIAGVLAHLIERSVAGDGPDANRAGDPSPLSAGLILDAAVESGVGLRVIQGSVPPDLAYPPEAAAVLGDALSDGWIAVAPSKPVDVLGGEHLGWWLVDPATGWTIDQLEDGTGAALVMQDQSMAEYGQALRNIWAQVKPYVCIGWTVAEVLHLVHAAFEEGFTDALVLAVVTNKLHHAACH